MNSNRASNRLLLGGSSGINSTNKRGQADGLGLQIHSGHRGPRLSGRGLCGDQAHHGQHRGCSIGELPRWEGIDIRDASGVATAGPRPYQPLGHGGLGHQEGSGDGIHFEAGSNT